MLPVAQPQSARHREALGEAIKDRREKLAISQEALAASAKVHRNYVGRAERGEVNPTLATLQSLADALDVKLSRLIADYERRLGL